jgi:hypothetical protein
MVCVERLSELSRVLAMIDFLPMGRLAKKLLMTSIITMLFAACARCADVDPDPSIAGRRRSEWIKRLKDEYPENRIQAVKLFRQLVRSDPDAVTLIASCRFDKNREIQSIVFETLLAEGPYGYSVLFALIDDIRTNSLSENALKVLVSIGHKAIHPIRDLLSDTDPHVRASAAHVLGYFDFDESISALFQALREPTLNVRMTAARALGRLKYVRQSLIISGYLTNEYIPLIIDCASELPEGSEKEGLMYILADKRIETLHSTLFFIVTKKFARNCDSDPHKLETDVLPKSKALVLLEDALKDENKQTRVDAALAIGRMRSRNGVPGLISALKDRDSGVRLAAATGLWIIGSSATDAVPGLTDLLNDPDKDVREQAAETLRLLKAE